MSPSQLNASHLENAVAILYASWSAFWTMDLRLSLFRCFRRRFLAHWSSRKEKICRARKAKRARPFRMAPLDT